MKAAIQQKIKVHYLDIGTGKMIYEEHNAFVITPELLKLDNRICLINTCFDPTGFESVPAEIESWVDQFDMDDHHYPEVDRLWGTDKSIYAYSLFYEIANEKSDKGNAEYPFNQSYQEQLDGIIQAAGKIAEAIPYAGVRVNECITSEGCHELEVNLFHPCEPADIDRARDVLERQFEYVWFIGMDKRK